MWGDWRDGWAKRHPLQWGAYVATIWFCGTILFAVVRHGLTAAAGLLALGFGLGAFVLGTIGAYFARRMKPD